MQALHSKITHWLVRFPNAYFWQLVEEPLHHRLQITRCKESNPTYLLRLSSWQKEFCFHETNIVSSTKLIETDWNQIITEPDIRDLIWSNPMKKGKFLMLKHPFISCVYCVMSNQLQLHQSDSNKEWTDKLWPLTQIYISHVFQSNLLCKHW